MDATLSGKNFQLFGDSNTGSSLFQRIGFVSHGLPAIASATAEATARPPQ